MEELNDCGEHDWRKYDGQRWICLKPEGHSGRHRYTHLDPKRD